MRNQGERIGSTLPPLPVGLRQSWGNCVSFCRAVLQPIPFQQLPTNLNTDWNRHKTTIAAAYGPKKALI
jgi:hypothetical protein